MKLNSASPFANPRPSPEVLGHLSKIVAHLREIRTELCTEFTHRLVQARWLDSLDSGETSAEATLLYDEYVAALESGRIESLQDCACHVSDRLLARGVEIYRILGVVRLLRSLVTRSLFARFRHVADWSDFEAPPKPADRDQREWRTPEAFRSSGKIEIVNFAPGESA